MSNTVISVENVSKQYHLGVIGTGSFRNDLKLWWAKTRNKPNPLALVDEADHGNRENDILWALRDVSFKVEQGEAFGIIGRNGAGKSTLLKILSRVTTPTSGEIKVKGRIASLLEVGTGFHPELTGRENVILNGSIMGMSRAEVLRKFDEIVDFSGVEKFIDTPVKRYSSGMYVRLAFAVAAHLDPDILVIDEVLAVGDADFQKKCLGKMGDEAKEGRTVIFVSHNMQAIRNLCQRCILLNRGEILIDADTDTTLRAYNTEIHNIKINKETGIGNNSYRRGNGAIRFTSIALMDLHENNRYTFEMNETIRFEMAYQVFKEIQGLAVYIEFRSTLTGDTLTSARHLISSKIIYAGTSGKVVIDLSDNIFRPGEYSMYLHISGEHPNENNFDLLDDLTPPLIIVSGENNKDKNFNALIDHGYFSISSKLVSNEILFSSE